jgi:hypothetical protein
VKAENTTLKIQEMIESRYRNQTGNHAQKVTKYEKNIAINHLLGRDFLGILGKAVPPMRMRIEATVTKIASKLRNAIIRAVALGWSIFPTACSSL